MIRRALKKISFFYSFLNYCIHFKHSKMKLYNHLWITVSMSVRPSSVQTNFTFWRWRHQIFSSIKITGISSWPIDRRPHSGVSGKIEVALRSFLLFMCSSQNEFDWRTAPPNKPKKSQIIFMSSRWCQKLFVDLKQWFVWVLTTQSTCLYNQVSLSIVFPEKYEKNSEKEKNWSGAFYSECRFLTRRFLGSGRREGGGEGEVMRRGTF